MNNNRIVSPFFILLLTNLASNTTYTMLRPTALHKLKNIATLHTRRMCSKQQSHCNCDNQFITALIPGAGLTTGIVTAQGIIYLCEKNKITTSKCVTNKYKSNTPIHQD